MDSSLDLSTRPLLPDNSVAGNLGNDPSLPAVGNLLSMTAGELSQQSGSSSFTEYSIAGGSPLRPTLRSGSEHGSSMESRGVFSVNPSLTDTSASQQTGSLSDAVSSQVEHSLTDNTSSSEIGSLDLTRAEGRSLDLSSGGRSSDPGFSGSSQGPGVSPGASRRGPEGPPSMDTDGSLDLSKSAAALTTLQSVPVQPASGPNMR